MLLSMCRISSEFLDEEGQGVSQHCWWETKQREIKSCSFQQIATKPIVLICQTSMILNYLEVGKRGRANKSLKTSGQQQFALHSKDILGTIRIIAYIYQILNLGYLVCFGIFGSDPQSSDAKKLQFVARNLFLREIEVDEFDHEEVCFPHKLVLLMNLYKPIQQHSSHVLTQLCLQFEIIPKFRSCLCHHEALYIAAVELLLRGSLDSWLRRWKERLIGRVILIPAGLCLLFGLDMAGLAKFHSKQQRMNNEIVQSNMKNLSNSKYIKNNRVSNLQNELQGKLILI